MTVAIAAGEAQTIGSDELTLNINVTVTALTGGGYVLSWEQRNARADGIILFQRYDADDRPVGTVTTVNKVPFLQYQHVVTALADGAFVVAWTDNSRTAGDGLSSEIRGQVFSATGARVGAEFIANTTIAKTQDQPAITALGTGGFVVAWHDRSNSVNLQDDIRYQLFNADGTRQGVERLVEPYEINNNNQDQPILAPIGYDGRFAVIYTDIDSNSDVGVFMKPAFDESGDLYNQTEQVNAIVAGTQRPMAAAGLTEGRMVVVYLDVNSQTLRFQMFDPGGGKSGSDRPISTTIADYTVARADVVGLPDGGFAVVFGYNTEQISPSEPQPYQRLEIYNAAGALVQGDIRVGAPTDANDLPSLSVTPDGDLLLAWTRSSNADQQYYAPTVQRFGLYEDLSGSSSADTVIGTNGRDRVLTFQEADVLFGAGGGDYVFGADGDDYLSGDDGNDQLFGAAGSDALFGGDGDDVLDASGSGGADAADDVAGGDGVDTVSYEQSTGFVRVDLTNPATNLGDAAGDTYSSIENVRGTASEDLLAGNALANDLNGGAGSDTLTGGGGADRLSGGAGEDLASYSTSAVGLIIDMKFASSSTGDALGDTFTSIEAVFGTAFNDTIRGTVGVQSLQGGEGNDVLEGRGGGDVLSGGGGVDIASYTQSTALTVDLAVTANNTGDALGDTYDSIEALFGSKFADTLRGDANANTLSGREGADVLQGRAGNDRLFGDGGADVIFGEANDDVVDGGEGGDTLLGGDGADLLTGRAGADVIDGGAGTDTVDFREKTVSVVVSLNGASNVTVRIGGLDEDTLRNVERIYGGSAADSLGGDAGANLLSGYAGSDTLRGAGGADVLTGGDGADTFRYVVTADSTVAAAGRDTITDFTSGADRLELSLIDANTALAGNQAFVFGAMTAGQAGRVQVSANGANSWLVQGDVTGDGVADFGIVVNGTQPLAGDFVL